MLGSISAPNLLLPWWQARPAFQLPKTLDVAAERIFTRQRQKWWALNKLLILRQTKAQHVSVALIFILHIGGWGIKTRSHWRWRNSFIRQKESIRRITTEKRKTGQQQRWVSCYVAVSFGSRASNPSWLLKNGVCCSNFMQRGALNTNCTVCPLMEFMDVYGFIKSQGEAFSFLQYRRKF